MTFLIKKNFDKKDLKISSFFKNLIFFLNFGVNSKIVLFNC